MPTYQYACTNPDGRHEFELVQSFTDAPLSECTVCSSPVRKVYGSVGVVFKGSGFYRTDSRAASNGSSGTSKDSSAKEATSKESAGKSSAKEASSAGSSSSTSASTSSSSGSKAAG